ncbi:electron transport complex subunit RsxG [Methylocaldum szegediense]|uniref:Ion-translocating oxidoreductase complex subunit G n=1 Tax=Methylocaldum szegediense TaxID=73780 RepID=A0ABM9I8Y4_9GAMM|nr:electron transport complex subunit RsxG [Methylocaldum szegediense]CAI8965152.1 SoxR [2Fe-2S] reducing system protein RsxG [Methylocaldum szegediense]
MSFPKSIINAAAALGLFAVIGIGLVALVHDGTKERIDANEQAVLLRTLESLIPAEWFDNDILTDTITATDPRLGTDNPVTIYRARKDGNPVAAILSPVAPDGYNGAIKLLVAVRVDGSLAGVRVVSHRETPGLGDPIDTDKSDWIFTFDGRSLDNPSEARWKVKRDGGDFDQFTGATITPRAVVKAVYQTLIFFERHKDRLFEQEAGTALRMNL